MLRDDPDKYNRVVRAMVETQRGGRTTRRVPSVKRRRVGLGSPSRIMASRAGEIEERGEDVAEGINNGDERGVGEDDEREGGAAGEGVVEDVVDDGVSNEEGGAVEQSVGRLKSRMEVVHPLQGVHRQLETVTKENGRLEERLRQVEEKNRALQDKLAALESKNAEVAEKKPITKTESNSRSDCCKEACASLRALVESFKEERAQMLLQSQEQEEMVRQNDLSDLTRKGELHSGAVKLKDQRGRGWLFGSARLIFFATLVVVVAFAYLHMHRLTLGRATNFPI